MKNEIKIIDEKSLENKTYTIRGQKVMLDSDLADIYGYTLSAFNQQVQRNKEKFEKDFMFQLTKEEAEFVKCKNIAPREDDINLKSQFVISSWGGARKLPYVFTVDLSNESRHFI